MELRRVEFRVLGPVEAVGASETLPLGGPKPRTLLAALLLDVNTAVTTDLALRGAMGREATGFRAGERAQSRRRSAQDAQRGLGR